MVHVRALTTAALALAAGGLAAAGPAVADSHTQSVAFTVANGTLAITPGTPATGATSALAGGLTTVTVPLGLTTITDTRISSVGWAVSAATTDFLLSAGSTTVTKSQAAFAVPVAPVSALGSPTVTFVYAAAPTAVDATGTTSNLVVAVATGVNTGTFSPQLVVTIPNGSASGAYTSTVTQTVV